MRNAQFSQSVAILPSNARIMKPLPEDRSAFKPLIRASSEKSAEQRCRSSIDRWKSGTEKAIVS